MMLDLEKLEAASAVHEQARGKIDRLEREFAAADSSKTSTITTSVRQQRTWRWLPGREM